MKTILPDEQTEDIVFTAWLLGINMVDAAYIVFNRPEKLDKANIDPLPQLESFYIFAAIELGDPDQKGWIRNQALRFYDLFRQWHKGKKYPCEPAEALFQYILWYDRESRKVKAHS